MQTFQYTWFPSRNATEAGVRRQGTLLDAYPPHVITARKESAGCVGAYTLEPNKRLNENVRAVSCVALDVDFDPTTDEARITQEAAVHTGVANLRAAGLEFLFYSSYSNGRPKRHPPYAYIGYRIIIPFAVPLETAAIPADYRTIANEVVRKFSLAGNPLPVSQPWYLPSTPPPPAPPATYVHVPGAALDWRELKVELDRLQVRVKPYDYSQAPYVPVNLTALVTKLRDYATRGANKSARALAFVLAPRAPGPDEVKSRHMDIVLPATRQVAWFSKPGQTVDDLMAVFEPWCACMQIEQPEHGRNWLDDTRRALADAMRKLPQWRADEAAKTLSEIEMSEARAKARANIRNL